MRYQWISRVLGNDLIEVDRVMAPFAREVLARAAVGGLPVVLAIDQSQANEGHQMLMVSLRLGGRALPLAWRMRRAKGTLGFDVQKEVLEAVVALLGRGARVLLMGDRFYGSPALIGWCREQGWGWRLRCKESLIVLGADGEETTLGACFARGERLMSDVLVTRKHALTNVAMVHGEGHKAPWIIALSDPPTVERAAEYRQRWGSRRCSRTTRRAASISKPARSSEPTGSTASSWSSAWRSTGPSPPACGMRSKTPVPPKKSRRNNTQERRSKPELMVQTRSAAHPVLPATPHPAPTPMGRMEK